LQDGSGLAEDQPRAAEHSSSLGDDPSGHEMKFTENPSGHETEFAEKPFGHETKFAENPFGHETEVAEDPPQVPRKRRTRKSHYVAPPPVPTNPGSRPIIKPVGER
jgi:hypothetical protein